MDLAVPESERPRIRVAALITIDERVVLVRHRKDDATYHLLPGGGVEHRETLAQALVREVAEETGLGIAVGRPLLISDTIAPDGSRHAVNIVFDATVTHGSLADPAGDPRIEAVELVDSESLSTLDLRPPIAGALVRALASRPTFAAEYLGAPYSSK